MADTLLSKYGADPDQYEIIREAAERENFYVLEYFTKYPVDFNKCNIYYFELISPDNAEILQFWQNHGFNCQKSRSNASQMQALIPMASPNTSFYQFPYTNLNQMCI